MPKKVPKRTKDNPFGLTYKQNLVIKDIEAAVKSGNKMDLVKSVEKFYNVKNRASAKSVAAYNMKAPKFRDALVNSLTEKGIVGANSESEDVLIEGLRATTKDGDVDFNARLNYVKELNKIVDVYAPVTKRNLNLTAELSEKQVDERIKQLQEELE